LGTSAKVEKIEIQWPSGKQEEISVPGVDRIFRVVEGQGAVER